MEKIAKLNEWGLIWPCFTQLCYCHAFIAGPQGGHPSGCPFCLLGMRAYTESVVHCVRGEKLEQRKRRGILPRHFCAIY